MKLIDFVVPRDFELAITSDVHLGLLQHHAEGFKEAINDCEKKRNRFFFCGGDLVEGRPQNHPYHDADTLAQDLRLPELQYEAFESALITLAKKRKIVAIDEGNHDRYLSRNYGNRVEAICRRLKVNFGTYVSIVNFKDKTGKSLFKFYYTHGRGTVNSAADNIIRRNSNMELAVQRKLMDKAADCMLMGFGHTHKLIICPPRTKLHLVSDGTRLQQIYSRKSGNSRIINENERWYINSGSFVKTSIVGKTTYSEEFMYNPTELGYPLVKVQDGEIVDIEKKIV